MRNTRQPEIDTCGCARPAIPIDRFSAWVGRRRSTNNKKGPARGPTQSTWPAAVRTTPPA